MLAHQGGWDEILLVLAPVALFGLLLYIANKRAEALGEDDEADVDVDADVGGDGDDR